MWQINQGSQVIRKKALLMIIEVEEWIKFVNKECKSSAIKYLVGNKIDLYEVNILLRN